MQSPTPNPARVGQAVPSITYRIETDTVTTVKQQTIRNGIRTTLRQSPYGLPGAGPDAVLIEQLDFSQTDRSPLALLLNELNPINERLIFDLSPQGDLLSLRNRSQVEARWHQLKPGIVARYGQSREGVAFIQAFEQQIRNGEALLANFRQKGAYGVLLPGLFGLSGAVREGVSSRLITGFFGPLDLPLLVETTVLPSTSHPGGRDLHVTTRPDPARFDEAQLVALAKQAMDLPNFVVEYRIEGKETYTLAADHRLVAARQTLTAVIENCYHHYTQHTLTLL